MTTVDSTTTDTQRCPVSPDAKPLTGVESRLDPMIRNNPFPFYRALREQQVEAQRLIEATRAALASDGDLLEAGEREAIERLLADVSLTMATDELESIRRATEALVAGTDDFAARRMDRSIRAALAGRSVAELAR